MIFARTSEHDGDCEIYAILADGTELKRLIRSPWGSGVQNACPAVVVDSLQIWAKSANDRQFQSEYEAINAGTRTLIEIAIAWQSPILCIAPRGIGSARNESCTASRGA